MTGLMSWLKPRPTSPPYFSANCLAADVLDSQLPRTLLFPYTARFRILPADHVKFHEVSCAAHKERRPRHDTDYIAAIDQTLFQQPFLGGLYEFLDVFYFADRSRHHAPVKREPPACFLNRRKRNNRALRAMF